MMVNVAPYTLHNFIAIALIIAYAVFFLVIKGSGPTRRAKDPLNFFKR